MSRRHFEITLTASIEIDDAVFKATDNQDWRESFFDYWSDEEVAKHIAFNVLRNGLELTQIDGFADLSDDLVSVLEVEAHAEEYS